MSDRQMVPSQTIQQIGIGNYMAISGCVAQMEKGEGRYPDLILPVGHGYRVRITLDADDTYSVIREWKSGSKLVVKGTQEGVYCDEIGEVAYRASCYHNVDFGEHVTS